MSQITDFFINGGTDHQGRTLESMLAQDDFAFDGCHDFIQFLFPLHEASRHSDSSPVLTPEDANLLAHYEIAKGNMRKCLARFRKFLGLDPADAERVSAWCHKNDHNLLRITRAIRSLRLFGLSEEAISFFAEVTKQAENYDLTGLTIKYWERALTEPVFQTLV